MFDLSNIPTFNNSTPNYLRNINELRRYWFHKDRTYSGLITVFTNYSERIDVLLSVQDVNNGRTQPIEIPFERKEVWIHTNGCESICEAVKHFGSLSNYEKHLKDKIELMMNQIDCLRWLIPRMRDIIEQLTSTIDFNLASQNPFFVVNW